jgi:hypothetical protein
MLHSCARESFGSTPFWDITVRNRRHICSEVVHISVVPKVWKFFEIVQSAVMNTTSHTWKVSFTTKINLVTRKWKKYHIFIFFFTFYMVTLRFYNHLTMTIQLHKLRDGDGKWFFNRLVSITFFCLGFQKSNMFLYHLLISVFIHLISVARLA